MKKQNKFLLSDPTGIVLAAEAYFEENSIQYNKEFLKTFLLNKIIEYKSGNYLANATRVYRGRQTVGLIPHIQKGKQTVSWKTIKTWLEKYNDDATN